MGHRKFIGAAAGGTLGYIFAGKHGIIPGARLGHKLGSMARPRSVSRGRTRSPKRITGAPVTPARSRSFKRIRKLPFASRSRSLSRTSGRSSVLGKRSGIANAVGDDEGKSRFVNKHRTKKKFLKGFKKIAAPSFLNCSLPQRLPAPTLSGEQGVHDLASWKGSSIATELPHFGRLMLQDALAVLRATDPTPATTVGGTDPTAATRKMVVKWATTSYSIKNMTNVPLRVVLYDCVCRRDFGSFAGASGSWSGGLTNEFVNLPGVANNNAQSFSMPGATPFQSQQFCQFFKVRRVTKFELHPGTVHCHRVTTRPGGMLSAEYINNFAAFKGLTTQVLAVITGGVVDDNAAVSAVVTTSNYVVDVVAESRLEVTTMERSRTSYVQWNNLSTTLPIASQFSILEDMDTVSPVAEA